MNGSICLSAPICGAFNAAVCKGNVDCDGPIKSSPQTENEFKKVLPPFSTNGQCCNCSKEKKLAHVSGGKYMCKDCWILLVLPRRSATPDYQPAIKEDKKYREREGMSIY